MTWRERLAAWFVRSPLVPPGVPPLTFLLVAAEPVGQPVALGRGRQHEGEAHEERCILGQRAVGVGHLAGLSGEVSAAAGGVAHAQALS